MTGPHNLKPERVVKALERAGETDQAGTTQGPVGKSGFDNGGIPEALQVNRKSGASGVKSLRPFILRTRSYKARQFRSACHLKPESFLP